MPDAITETIRNRTISLLKVTAIEMKKENILARLREELPNADYGTLSTQVNMTALRHPTLVTRPRRGWYLYIGR